MPREVIVFLRCVSVLSQTHRNCLQVNGLAQSSLRLQLPGLDRVIPFSFALNSSSKIMVIVLHWHFPDLQSDPGGQS